MPSDDVAKWLHSGKAVVIAGHNVRPRMHPVFPEMPLSIVRGQAEAFFTTDDTGSEWIIKKFHPGRSPEPTYLQRVGSLLPQGDAFDSGTRRVILGPADTVGVRPGRLAAWLDGTILMPRVSGLDWAGLADQIRSGQVSLDVRQRGHLGAALIAAVGSLESAGCAHRDLSCSNVYFEPDRLALSLIDWDGLYHSSLTMPDNTTCGTPGYVPPFVATSEGLDATKTWGPTADRFALAVILVEILAMERGSPLAEDGGLFDQRDLDRRAGASIRAATDAIRGRHPLAVALFQRALSADDNIACPAPDEWLGALPGIGVPAPPIESLGWDEADFLERLARMRPRSPLWPAPSLDDVPEPVFDVPRITQPPAPPALPADPFGAG